MADYSYKIGGCDVKFPHKAYGTQLSFMSKVIQALQQRHNALLEAPTGSGKTLSLLCSALAWQEREKQRIEEGGACLARRMAAQQRAEGEGFWPPDGPAPDGPAPAPVHSPRRCPADAATDLASDSSISQDLANGAAAARAAAAAAAAAPDNPVGGNGFLPADHPGAAPEIHPESSSAPRIFYATRTHSQIAQVVRELKRSGFTPRMAVLASKQHYCVNKEARDAPEGIHAKCDDLMKGGGGCDYFKGVAGALEDGPGAALHDIEDLSHAAKTGHPHFCPYFLARKLASGADLVFGPYSYFIDPVIRRSMGVEVENAVVIFDEAHNIEDVAREAASLELERQHAWETLKALARARKYNPCHAKLYEPLIGLMCNVLGWMDAADSALSAQGGAPARGRYEDPQERVVGGAVMLGELARMGLGPGDVDALWAAYEAVRKEDEEMLASGRSGARGRDAGPAGAPGAENGPPDNDGAPKPAGKAGRAVPVGAGPLGIVSRLIQVVRMLYQVSDNGGRDFRLVSRRAPMPPGAAAAARGRGSGRVQYEDGSQDDDRDMCGRTPPPTTHLLHLSLWCLNPSVAFRQVSTPAHSVVLTSGTLSPLDSFASELGAPFQIRLEAPHVVNMARQVWAGVVPAAPDGRRLLATYAHTSKPEFLDSMGYTVAEACAAIPDGVLLFLPSYALLDRCVLRWKETGTWDHLSTLKSALVVEPRRGGGPALQDAMDDFYGGVASGRGALMVAVCRGKVSEGLDFADANARGVLVVGIPFPNLKDKKVEAKRAFNDEGARTMGLLSGSVWYEQQAFRALNQAIGRCIRHRADWGAIVFIDERFGQAKTQRGLSKWVQRSVGVHRTFREARESMGAFFARLAADPPAALPGAAPAVAAPPACHGRTGVLTLNAIQLLMNGAKVEMDAPGEVNQEIGAAGAVVPLPPAVPRPGPAERLDPANAAVRKAPLHSYVTQDLEFRADLVSDANPGILLLDAAACAVAAILGDFDRAIAVAAGPSPMHSWAGANGMMPPWGVVAVLSTVPHTLPAAVLAARHPSILEFAAVHLANLNVVTALEAMRGGYVEVFCSMGLQGAVEAAKGVVASNPEVPGVEGEHYAGAKRKREEDGGGHGPGWVPAGAGF